MDMQTFFAHWEQNEGLVKHLGIGFKITQEGVECHMHVQDHHSGAPGVSHGGTVMSLLDTALGARALVYALSKGCLTSTVEMKINLMRPAKVGMDLATMTTILSAGRSLLVLTSTAHSPQAKGPIAFAVGTFNLYGHATVGEFKDSRLLGQES